MALHLRDKVESLVGREPVLIDPGDTLRRAANVMWTQAVGVLVVGQESHPQGVISERDVVAKVAQGADPDVVTVREAMTTYVVSVRRGDRLVDAATQMLGDEIRHVPVLDDRGNVVGMLSVRDVLRPLLLDALST